MVRTLSGFHGTQQQLLQLALQTEEQASAKLLGLMVAKHPDPKLPLDEQGNTLLHKAQSPDEISALLMSPPVSLIANAVAYMDRKMEQKIRKLQEFRHRLSSGTGALPQLRNPT